jgi:predicted nucleotidyltransferase
MTEKVDIDREIEVAVKILQEQGAHEVFVFGSAANGTMMPDSDIDLAVRGLPPENYFRAMSLVGFAISRQIDLIDLDEPNEFTQYLERKGELKRVA